MKIFNICLLTAMVAVGLVSCDHDDITPNDSNTALSPEEIAKRNNEEIVNDNPSAGADWKVVKSSDEKSDDDIIVKINTGSAYQTMEGFGASDCWLGEFVGKNYTDKDKMAKLLFSQDTLEDGSLTGIGLSMWRVNLGGGTAEQGADSKLEDVTRRAECYLNGNDYDWTKCAGQQYFMTEAKKYGVEKMLLFSNTPLVRWTKNGLGFSASGANANLNEENYADFAGYMADVAKHFTDNGIKIDYISPVNEPQYNWDGGQEGSGWQNAEIAKLVKALDEKLGDQKTEIIIPEAAKWTATYSETYENRSNQIKEFFGDGENSVKDLKHVHKVIGAHSYWEDRNWTDLEQIRSNAAFEAEGYGIGLWQTEWSMLDEYAATDNYPGLADAKYIDNALYLSRVIYSDLVWGNVSSWSYWTVWGQERWSQKNRFYLIKLGADVSDYKDDYTEDLTVNNNWAANVNLYVLGNYSRFIRPDYKRVDLDCGADKSFIGTAFISPDSKTLVAVYTNLTDKKIRVQPKLTGYEGYNKVLRFVTDESKKLERSNMSDDKVVIPAKSVTTIVYCK